MDDTPIPEGDIANNVRLSRCFFYVSDILRQVIDNGGINRDGKKLFSITAQQLACYDFTPFPITVSEISKRLAELCDDPGMKSLSPVQVNRWLEANGYLTSVIDPATEKSRKLPTPQGDELGITIVQKQNKVGMTYPAVVFNVNAQRFILSNLDEIKEFGK